MMTTALRTRERREMLGFMKVVVDAATERALGAAILGSAATRPRTPSSIQWPWGEGPLFGRLAWGAHSSDRRRGSADAVRRS